MDDDSKDRAFDDYEDEAPDEPEDRALDNMCKAHDEAHAKYEQATNRAAQVLVEGNREALERLDEAVFDANEKLQDAQDEATAEYQLQHYLEEKYG